MERDQYVYGELERIRNRLHSLESRAVGLELLYKRMTEEFTTLTHTINRLARKVDQLTTADKVEQAVEQALHNRGAVFPLSWSVRIIGGVSALVVIAAGLKGLIG
jgi:predicted nuclease with TOPRIM domain